MNAVTETIIKSLQQSERLRNTLIADYEFESEEGEEWHELNDEIHTYCTYKWASSLMAGNGLDLTKIQDAIIHATLQVMEELPIWTAMQEYKPKE